MQLIVQACCLLTASCILDEARIRIERMLLCFAGIPQNQHWVPGLFLIQEHSAEFLSKNSLLPYSSYPSRSPFQITPCMPGPFTIQKSVLLISCFHFLFNFYSALKQKSKDFALGHHEANSKNSASWERIDWIEQSSSGWKPGIIPLYDTRLCTACGIRTHGDR